MQPKLIELPLKIQFLYQKRFTDDDEKRIYNYIVEYILTVIKLAESTLCINT